MKKQLLTGILVLCLLCTMLAGCGSQAAVSGETATESVSVSEAEESAVTEAPAQVTQPEEQASVQSAEETEVSAAEEPAEETSPDHGLYQLVDDTATLTMLTEIASTLATEYDDLNEASNVQYLESITNVHIDFITATSDTYSDQFNLRCASGTLPDLVYAVGNHYSSGIDGAIDDELVIDLMPYLEDYAPNYLAAIDSDDSIRKDIVSDAGAIGSFYSIYDETPRTTSGFIIRQDWLDEAGLSTPVTYDDWENTLLTFKENEGLDEPILMSTNGFFSGDLLIGGYGVAGINFQTPFDNYMPFYVDGGEVKFGPLEEGYEEYVTMLAKWYQEGLFNDDFLLDTNSNAMDATYLAKITEGQVGVALAMTNTVQNVLDAGLDVVGVEPPVQAEGDTFHFGSSTSRVANELLSVSTNCEDVELAMKWLDLGYTEEGTILNAYGVEGETFVYDEDGKPAYTDIILNNPDYGFSTAMSNLIPRFMAAISVVSANDVAYDEGVFAAIKVWSADRDSSMSYPVAAALTVDETDTFNTYYSDISTYLDENVAQFIIGAKDLSEFDAFRSEIQSMGIDECIAVKQDALDRYLAD